MFVGLKIKKKLKSANFPIFFSQPPPPPKSFGNNHIKIHTQFRDHCPKETPADHLPLEMKSFHPLPPTSKKTLLLNVITGAHGQISSPAIGQTRGLARGFARPVRRHVTFNGVNTSRVDCTWTSVNNAGGRRGESSFFPGVSFNAK
ncbi:hypothetical protein CDAR_107371 [Caerostris darwini]|uniref:Uncharacterized protein n=1 Tax=Caerostris darwini TaxID=1538125 RepID=A0AAV4NE76_9ARAC|nr:hypothetical protein CDAR_107371 [Caerostris darwini]